LARTITEEEKTAACGTWCGNITSENIVVKHFMDVTWVIPPISADAPKESEIFGHFYNSGLLLPRFGFQFTENRRLRGRGCHARMLPRTLRYTSRLTVV